MTIALGTTGSAVGRGRLGLRSGMRDFVDLMSESTGLREALVELRPGKLLGTLWTLHSGAAYKQSLSQAFDGVALDVVAVRTLVDPSLVRAETAALCVSTAGTYYYDPDAGSPELYVHLTDGSDPGSTEVSAAFALYLSDRAVIHPALGPEKLVDGGFETWTSSTNATYWTESAPAGATVQWSLDYVRGYGSQRAVRLTYSSAVPSEKITNGATVSGALYRLAGSYRTVGATANIRVGDGTDYITSDGRTTTTGTGGLDLADTGGEWRRFVLDFRAWASSSAIEVLLRSTGLLSGYASGDVWVDSLTWRRIYRYVLWEPRLVDGAAPVVDVGKNDVWFGPARVGSGDFAIANADGWADDALSALNILGAEVRVAVAGAFGDGQEVLIDDARQAMVGSVQDVEADDAQVALSVEDVRATIHVDLPKRSFAVTTGGNRAGKKKPLLFGTKTNITPTRIGVNANGYGLYEIADCTDHPTGIKQIDAVYAYLDETAAAAKLASNRISLVAGTHYTADLPNGQFQMTRDVGPYNIASGGETGGNTWIDFSIGGGELNASLTTGLYTAYDLAAHIASVMTTAAGTTISCSYSESTHKFTISKAAGTLQLLAGTGTNVGKSPWTILGFTSNADYTAALSYTSDVATFDASDDTHDGFILRVDAQGYKDDTSGTYTGSSGALIDKASDIARLIWRRFMLQDLALIDSASFAATRAGAAQNLGIYIEDTISSQDVFSILEQTALGDITIDGSGVLFFDLYPTATDQDAPTISDAEFYAYTESRSRADVFARVQVFYDRDPTTHEAAASAVETDSVKLRHGRIDAQDFETYLTLDTDADALATSLATLAAAAPIVVKATAGPILFDRRVSQRVFLTRSRAPMQSGGTLAAMAHRIRSMKKRFQDGLVDAVLVPFVDL